MACIEKRGTLGGTCLNVGCIPSKSLLNNSALYHQILHDTKNRGIEVGDVKLNLAQMMKAKETSVSSLTKGIEFLFKKNNVEYIKGTGSFIDEHTVKINLNEGGETSVRGKNILIATGSESTPFPGLEIDEKRVITSTGAIALQEVPKKMVVIGGGIIGLEMGSVWSRLGSEVTVVEFLGQIGGPGMDAEVSKSIQKILGKQGMKFKLNTKVTSGDTSGNSIKLEVEAAKGGKQETVRRPSISRLTLVHEFSLTFFLPASLMLTLSSSPSDAAPTQPGSVWRISVWRRTSAGALSSIASIAPNYRTFVSSATALSGPCSRTRRKKKAWQRSNL